MTLVTAAQEGDLDEVRRIMAEDEPSAEDFLATVDNDLFDWESNALEMILTNPEFDDGDELPLLLAKAMVEKGVLSHKYASGWNTFQHSIQGIYDTCDSCPDHNSYDPSALVYMVEHLAPEDLVHEEMEVHPVSIAGVVGIPELFNALLEKLDPSSFLNVEDGKATVAHLTATASTRNGGEHFDEDYKPILDRLLPMLSEEHLYHRDEDGCTILESADWGEPNVSLCLSTLLEHLPDAAFGNDENRPPLLKYGEVLSKPEFAEEEDVDVFRQFIARTPSKLLLETDEGGNTVLHHAVNGNNEELIKAILLHAPAAIKNVSNESEETPMSLASKSGNKAVLDLLSSRPKNAV